MVAVVFVGSVPVAAEPQAHKVGQSNSYVVNAVVVNATPIEVVRSVERPVKTCERLDQTSYYRDEPRERRHGGVGAQILGGLVGGVIGNQFGGGKGNKALTIAGALIGSSIGKNRAGRPNQRHYSTRGAARRGNDRSYQPEYHCRTNTSTREIIQVTGYDVTYRYHNTLYKRRMDFDPGDTLELRIRATPDLSPIVADS